MRNAVRALSVILISSAVAFASNCPTTTYDQYLGSSFSCGIGDKTFSDFSYAGTSIPAGFAISANEIGVTPITTPGDPGLQFGAGWLASTSTGVREQDSLFQFTVNVNPGGAPITDLTLAIGGASFVGTGEVIVAETACLGAVLPACLGGQLTTLTVFDGSAGSQLVDTVSFAGVNEISVSKDLTVSAGTDGEATVSAVSDQFSEGTATTPEPGTLSMLGLGAAALVGSARRKLNV